MAELTDREIQDLIVLIRTVQLQYNIDQFTEKELREFLRVLEGAKKEILDKIKKRGKKLTDFNERRYTALLTEFDKLTVSVQEYMEDTILDISATTEAKALAEYSDIYSFGGRVANFNTIALSATQIKAIISETPVGGRLLSDWVGDNFRGLSSKIKYEISKGMLEGEGVYPLVRRLEKGLNTITRREAISLVRTYTQSANVDAQKRVFEANKDVIDKIKWSSVLEPGSFSTGRGTCPRCAALDGNKYPMNDHPPCPLHIRCRCVLLPVTKTWRELGLDIDEIEEVKRPYTIRGKVTKNGIEEKIENIDAGGRRKILEVGFHQGDYAKWYKTRGSKFKENIIGPRRKELIDKGLIDFKDIVNRETGELYTLDQLKVIYNIK